jgi:hypothetical protein
MSRKDHRARLRAALGTVLPASASAAADASTAPAPEPQPPRAPAPAPAAGQHFIRRTFIDGQVASE